MRLKEKPGWPGCVFDFSLIPFCCSASLIWI
jgi:hypothetical protein